MEHNKNISESSQEECIKLEEASFMLNMNYKTVRKYFHEGVLRGFQVQDNRRPIMIYKSSIDEFLERKEGCISTPEAAAKLNIDLATIRKFYKDGTLKGYQVNRKSPIYVTKESVTEFLRKLKSR